MGNTSRGLLKRFGNRRPVGASLVIFAILLLTLLALAGFAVDIGNLVVARQELRNAADAGALAGARCLYNDGDPAGEPNCPDSSSEVGDVNENANQVAYDAATANTARKTAVEVNWTSGNSGDIQRGHWSFGRGNLPRGFYPNNSTAAFDLWDHSTVALDEDVNFINAVQVTTRRQSTQVQAFFSRVLGFLGFEAQASAVAWVGFAGTLEPHEVDQPIAICDQSLLTSDGEVECSVGRFVPDTGETGGWTTFAQTDSVDQCTGAYGMNVNDADIRPLVCSTGNDQALRLGDPTATDNGQNNGSFGDLAACWAAHTNKTQGWDWTLPVLDCNTQGSGQIQPCSTLVGAVEVTVIWIQEENPSPGVACDETQQQQIKHAAPCQMDDGDDHWSWPYDRDGDGDIDNADLDVNGDGAIGDGDDRWDDFADYFDLITATGDPATVANGGWNNQTIYFKPTCEKHVPTGDSGGNNFGILAKIPRLVQ